MIVFATIVRSSPPSPVSARRRTARVCIPCLLACVLFWAASPTADAAAPATVAVVSGWTGDTTPDQRAATHAVRRILTDQLAGLPGVQAVGFSAAGQAAAVVGRDAGRRGKTERLRRLADKLGADVTLAITADPAGRRWRVSSTIHDSATNRTRTGPGGSVRFVRLFPVLGSIVEAVATRAGITLTPPQALEAQRTATDDPAAFLALGYALVAPPGTPLAEGKALEAVRRDPPFVEAHMELGRLYHAQGEYGMAADAYERVRSLRPTQPYLDYNAGLTYRALGDYEHAIAAYERARVATAGDPDIANNLGIVYYLAGDFAGARSAFEAALTLAPYDRRVRANLETVRAAMDAPLLSPGPTAETGAPASTPDASHIVPSGDPQVHVDTATIFYAQGEYERAVGQYRSALQQTPDDPDLLLALGRTYQHLARHAEALAAFEQVLEMEPAHAAAATGLKEASAALRLERQGTENSGATTQNALDEVHLARTYYRKGKRHYVRGEYAEAIAAYRRALQFTPEDTLILNSLGVAQYEAELIEDARGTFTRASALAPDDPAAMRNLEAVATGDARARLRDAEARGAFALLQVEVDDALAPEVAFLDGNEAFLAHEFTAAIEAFERAVALNPAHGRAWNNLGAARVRVGDYDGATAAFAQAAAFLDDNIVRANAGATTLLTRYAESDGAARTLLIALDDDPALAYRARMAAARAAYDRGDFTAAVSAYETVAALYPAESMPLNNLAATYYMLGRTADALAAVELALRRNPDDAEARANRAVIVRTPPTPEPAPAEAPAPPAEATIVVAYTPPPEPVPTPAEAAPMEADLAAAQAALASHDAQAAEAAYRRVLERAPANADALRGLASLWAAQGRWAAATDGFRRTAAVAPTDYPVAMAWGYAALRADRSAEAGQAFRQAVAVRPNSARARYNLAIAERRAGDVEAAIAACRAALELRPDFADAHYNLANLFLETERWDEAVAAFRRVLALDAANVSAYNNLAIAHWRRGEMDAAVHMWRAALALDPGCEFAQANLTRFAGYATTAGRT